MGSKIAEDIDSEAMKYYVHRATSDAEQTFGIIIAISCLAAIPLFVAVFQFFGHQPESTIVALFAAAGAGLIPIALAHDWYKRKLAEAKARYLLEQQRGHELDLGKARCQAPQSHSAKHDGVAAETQGPKPNSNIQEPPPIDQIALTKDKVPRVGESDRDKLKREQRIFIWGMVGTVAVGWWLGLLILATSPSQPNEALAVITLTGKAAWIYFVWRLSRFLEQPVWLTLVYCVLTPFSLLWVIPVGGLVLALRKARISPEHQEVRASLSAGRTSSRDPLRRGGEESPPPFQKPVAVLVESEATVSDHPTEFMPASTGEVTMAKKLRPIKATEEKAKAQEPGVPNEVASARRTFVAVSAICGVIFGIPCLLYIMKIGLSLATTRSFAFSYTDYDFEKDLWMAVVCGALAVVPSVWAFFNYDGKNSAQRAVPRD